MPGARLREGPEFRGCRPWPGQRAPARLAALVALMALVAGCGCSVLPKTLPRMAPDLRLPPGASVEVQGRHGPLTPARSAEILARLADSGEPTDIFSRHLALEAAIAGTPLSAGNRVTLLQDGPATYRAMFAAIATAQHHVHLETYILDDDEVGRAFARALLDRRARGVKVRVLRDSAGTFGTPQAFFDALQAGGVEVVEFNPLNPMAVGEQAAGWAVNERDHRKLLIVDGRVAFMGGINISSVYSGGSSGGSSSGSSSGSFSRPSGVAARPAPTAPRPAPVDARPPVDPSTASAAFPDGDTPEPVLAWRDTDLQLEGPVVADLQVLFNTAWRAQGGAVIDPVLPGPASLASHTLSTSAAGPHLVRVIGSSPEEPYSRIYATLLSAIASAETSIQITNAYFVPDPQLLTALSAAAQRGVNVVLILPSRTDSALVFHAGRAHYAGLLRAGVRIHERRGVILHSKTALIDGVWATVGSTNLDWRSFLHNHELNAVVLGPAFGEQLQALFDRDLAGSERIDVDAWERRGPVLRIKEWLSGLWAYWL